MISLEVTKIIAAPQAVVFAAWIDPEIVRKWFAPGNMVVADAKFDARQGGSYSITMKGAEQIVTAFGEFQEVTPVRRLVFTWGWQGDPAEPTLVTVNLTQVSKGTEIHLRHERFATEAARQMHADGWNGCLANLDRALAMQ